MTTYSLDQMELKITREALAQYIHRLETQLRNVKMTREAEVDGQIRLDVAKAALDGMPEPKPKPKRKPRKPAGK